MLAWPHVHPYLSTSPPVHRYLTCEHLAPRSQTPRACQSAGANTRAPTRGRHAPRRSRAGVSAFADVQRIGRTGRQGQPGVAYAFWSRQLRPLAPSTVELLERHQQKIDPYLAALAAEVRAEHAAPTPTAAAEPTEGKRESDANAGATGAAGVSAARGRLEEDDYDDCDDGNESGAQRWLSSRLVSPITGIAPTFSQGISSQAGAKRKHGKAKVGLTDWKKAKRRKDKGKERQAATEAATSDDGSA